MTSPEPDLLRQFLENSDARCPSCRYALRNCTSAKCPECGAALELGLRSRSAPAWWVAAMIGLAIAETVAALYLFTSLPSADRIASQDQVMQMAAAGFATASELIDWSILAQIAFVVCAGAAALAWLWSVRRRFGEWSPAAQAGVGLAGMIAPLLLIGGLALVGRGPW